MRPAYNGSLRATLDIQRSGKLAGTVAAGFREALGRQPHPDDLTTWREVLPLALEAAIEAIPPSSHLLVECPLPFNDQRIDLVFLGGRAGSPTAHLLELKRWGDSASSDLLNFVQIAGHPTPHPSYQVLSYAGKLRHLHSFGPSLTVDQSVMVVNGEAGHSAVLAAKFQRVLDQAPVFFAPKLAGLKLRLSRTISEGADDRWVKELLNGEYSQSQQLLQMVKLRQRSILSKAGDVLAASGWGLTEYQLLVHDRILNAIDSGHRAVFCVSGGPGSGKSLLAIHLFLESIGIGRRTILAVRNNRLNAALRHILETEVTGAQGMIKYFSTGNAGVEDSAEAVADVVICDEAQRLALRSPNVMLRAPIVVLIYDERQILNEAEQGTAMRFRELGKQIGAAPIMLQLPTPLRCRGGARYLSWLNAFLDNPSSVSFERDELAGYELRVFGTPQALRDYLAGRAHAGRVGLLASFTRASGRNQPRESRDLGRIRVPEMTPPVRWLMEPRTEYVPFWVEGRSNDLETCSSIYGAQGFELDYAGLIWGSDLVIRGGTWAVGDADDCYDAAPGSRRLATVMRADPDTAITLLRNRYRILLSRGIFGTAVYAEDVETRDYLSRVLGGFRY